MHISRQFMQIEDEYIYVWNSFILQVNIYISSQFMHLAGEYIYIYGIHSYARQISLYQGTSCISRVNISISCQIMYIEGEYVHIYIYIYISVDKPII